MADVDANGNPIPPTTGTTIATAWGGPVANQVVDRFTSAAQRDSIITSPSEGRVVYLEDAEQLQVYNATSWKLVEGPWQTWSPSYTNLTIGNGTVVARYVRQGDTVHGVFKFTLGATSAVGSNPTVSLPVTGKTDMDNTPIGSSRYLDASAPVSFIGFVRLGSSTTIGLRAIATSSTYAQTAGLSATVPMTWATSDTIQFSMTYQAA